MSKNNTFPIFIARLLMKMGDQILSFAIPLIIYESTRSVSWAGLSYFIERLPRIFFLPFAGLISDSFGIKRVLILSDGLRFILLASLYIGMSQFIVYIHFILPIVGALLAILNAQTFIALETFLSEVIQQDTTTKAPLYFQIAEQASVVLGPTLSYAIHSWIGNYELLLTAGFFYLISMFLLFYLNECKIIKMRINPKNPSIFQSLIYPFKIVLENSRLLSLSLLALSINLIAGLDIASSASIIHGRLNLNSQNYGQLQVSVGITSLVMMLILPFLNYQKHIERVGIFSFLIIFIGCLLSAISNNFITLIFAFVLTSLPMGVFNVYIRSKRALFINDPNKGAVTAVMLMIGQLGLPLAGLLLILYPSPEVRYPFHLAGLFAIITLGVTQYMLKKIKITKTDLESPSIS